MSVPISLHVVYVRRGWNSYSYEYEIPVELDGDADRMFETMQTMLSGLHSTVTELPALVCLKSAVASRLNQSTDMCERHADGYHARCYRFGNGVLVEKYPRMLGSAYLFRRPEGMELAILYFTRPGCKRALSREEWLNYFSRYHHHHQTSQQTN